MNWISLNGRNRGEYWLFKSDHFHVDLQPISETFTGEIAAKVSDAGAGLQPELSLEELVHQAKPAVVYLKGLDKAGSGSFVTVRESSSPTRIWPAEKKPWPRFCRTASNWKPKSFTRRREIPGQRARDAETSGGTARDPVEIPRARRVAAHTGSPQIEQDFAQGRSRTGPVKTKAHSQWQKKQGAADGRPDSL